MGKTKIRFWDFAVIWGSVIWHLCHSVCSYGWSQKRVLFVAVLCVSWPSQLVTLTMPSSNTSTPTWRTARSDFFFIKHFTPIFTWDGHKIHLYCFLFRFYPEMVWWACMLLSMEHAQYNCSLLVQRLHALSKGHFPLPFYPGYGI